MKPSKSLALRRNAPAFSRMDLLVLLVSVAFLALMLVPVMARNRAKPDGTQCMNNLRQLSLAWGMYAVENNGKIMPNTSSVGELGYGTGILTNQAWVYGYLSFASDDSSNTNSYYLAHSLMGPYVNEQTSIFKCPSDFWQCLEGTQLMDRVRSYSINYCMEGDADDAVKAQENIPIDEVSWDLAVPRYGYHKLTDPGGRLPGPAPASAWVLCDEHPNTINNGALSWGGRVQWADLPASYHESGDNFGFVDGHVEYHQWLTAYNPINNTGTCEPVNPSGSWSSPGILNPADYNWVTSHGTATYP